MSAVLEKPQPTLAMAQPKASPASFRDSMRALPNGVCVIATGPKGHRAGFTATSVCSVTADPPRLLVCVNRTVSAYGQLVASGRLSVNVLAQGQEDIAAGFAGQQPAVKGEDRFQQGTWSQSEGVPVLEEACASFVCRVAQRIEQSTHTVFICDVLDARRGDETGPAPEEALVYANGRFTRLQGC